VRNLVTGINGFAASHLADYLISRGEEVFGLARHPEKNENVRHLGERVKTLPCDIRNASDVRQVLETVRPERIYHLASVTFVPAVAQDWNASFDTIFFGTGNLLEAVKQLKLQARVLWVGSSEEYGVPPLEEYPLKESRNLTPVSLYGVAKASADVLADSYVRRDQLDVVRVRPFNHIGPRQESRFASSSFARQIAQIEAGADPVIKVGNLSARKDFTDVRDTVRAYHSIMEKGAAGEVYNVCTGKSLSVKAILEGLVSQASIPISVEVDPERYRPEPPVNYYGDHTFLAHRTGWHPEIPIQTTLRDILDYWRQQVAGKQL
jgi:GDP-4-dehydro-6-deoxy-D-mannose reductase